MANEMDTTLLDNLNSIKNSKADIKQALINKGQNPTDIFADYAQLIGDIQTGEDLSEELSAQEAKLAQLESILDGKTAGKVSTEIKSIYNGNFDYIHTYKYTLEPNKIYLFNAQPYGNGYVDSSFYVSMLFMTSNNSISPMWLAYLQGSMLQHITTTIDGLNIEFKTTNRVWWIMSLTEIPMSFDTYLTNSLGSGSSINITLTNPLKNYLFINKIDGSNVIGVYIVTCGITNANLYCRRLLPNSVYTSNETCSTTNPNILKCTNASGKSSKYALIEL